MKKVLLLVLGISFSITGYTQTYTKVDESTATVEKIVQETVRVSTLNMELERIQDEIFRTKRVQEQHNSGWNSYIASLEQGAITITQELDALYAAGVTGIVDDEGGPVVE